ncbi:serine/arginine repetitive matrix protein 1-like [Tigriopus californicus]|uniref:serine/arginine repetitive matrix protein 1-like n=1 Tax=Tigriopus californicus TaxID=6832 RepID=UPI0027DA4A05|nr:serine/arginine repetitive matrix protein 1-like [Tigriopus californicus]
MKPIKTCSVRLFFHYFQHAVMHGTSAVLLFLGSIAMLSDAFGTREDWIRGMITDLMSPTNSNHNIYKDIFLGNMYRIVKCCGADGPDDYPFLYDMSPPPECINHWMLGGRDYERGCARAFSIWLKAWAGGISGALIIGAMIEILLIVFIMKQIKYLKVMNDFDIHPRAPEKDLPPVPPHREAYDGMESEAFLPQKRQFFQPNTPQRSTSITHLSQPQPSLPPLHRTPSVRFGEVNQRQFQRSTESVDQLKPQIGAPMQPNPKMATSNFHNHNQELITPSLPKRTPYLSNVIASPPPVHHRQPEPRFIERSNQKKSILKSNTNSSTDESTRRDDTILLFGKGTGVPVQDPFDRERSSTMTSETMERFGGFDSDYQQRIFLNKPSDYEEITSPSLPSPMTNRRKKMPIPSKVRSRSRESLAKLSTASTSSSASEGYYLDEDPRLKRSRSPDINAERTSPNPRRKRSLTSTFPPPISPHLQKRNKSMQSSRADGPRRSSSRVGIADIFGSNHSLRRSRSGHLNRNDFDDPPRRSKRVSISDLFAPSHNLRRSRSGHLNRDDFEEGPRRQRSGSSHALFWGSRPDLHRSDSGPFDTPDKYREAPQRPNQQSLRQKPRNDSGPLEAKNRSKARGPSGTRSSTMIEPETHHSNPVPPSLPPRPKHLASKREMTLDLEMRGQARATSEFEKSNQESTIVFEERSTRFPGFVRHKRRSGSNLIETSI